MASDEELQRKTREAHRVRGSVFKYWPVSERKEKTLKKKRKKKDKGKGIFFPSNLRNQKGLAEPHGN